MNTWKQIPLGITYIPNYIMMKIVTVKISNMTAYHDTTT